jgi:hypothetical protein
MELVYEFSLRREAEVQIARQMLWNILDYAVGERLCSIKAALPAFNKNKGLLKAAIENTATHSETSSLKLKPWPTFLQPLTPASVASEPIKKHKYTNPSI